MEVSEGFVKCCTVTLYTDCFKIWADLNNQDNFPNTDQYLWNNKHIVIGGKSIFFKVLFEFGINFVSDLYTVNGDLITWAEWKNRGLSNLGIMLWNGIVSAIPKHLKGKLKRETFGLYINNKFTKIDHINSKTVCLEITHKVAIRLSREWKLADIVNLDYSKFGFSDVYTLPFLTTIDNRTHNFQFKLNHNILYTNKDLYDMNPNLVTSPKCTFCKSYDETILHLFCVSTVVKTFWQSLTTQFYQLPPFVDLSNADIILGNTEFSKLTNHIILLAKRHIYFSKMKDEKPTLHGCLSLIRQVHNIEKVIATRGGKPVKHISKWELLAPLF